MDETRSTVIVELRAPEGRILSMVVGRVPVVGEYIAWDDDHLLCVTHVIHSHCPQSKVRPASHMPDHTRFDNNGRISAVLYVDEVAGIPGLDIRDLSDLEPSD